MTRANPTQLNNLNHILAGGPVGTDYPRAANVRVISSDHNMDGPDVIVHRVVPTRGRGTRTEMFRIAPSGAVTKV